MDDGFSPLPGSLPSLPRGFLGLLLPGTPRAVRLSRSLACVPLPLTLTLTNLTLSTHAFASGICLLLLLDPSSLTLGSLGSTCKSHSTIRIHTIIVTLRYLTSAPAPA